MTGAFQRKNYLYLVIILVAVSIAAMISTVLSYRNSIDAARNSLKLQAYGIAASLEASLKGIDTAAHGKNNIFKRIVAEGRWEGIAYISLYDKSGVTLLHSNENLVGKKVQDTSIVRALETGAAGYDYMTLGTGEKVFVMNSPVKMNGGGKVLRLALHTYPAEHIVRQAKIQMISVISIIGILWLTGYFFIRAAKRSEALEMIMAEKERLAVLGEMSSVLAHEIRNPLGSIKGFAQYLSERDVIDRDSLAESLKVIISESKRLEALTEDLLAYAKPVEVKRQEFYLRELVEEAVRTTKPAGENAYGIEIRTSIPSGMKVNSDRDKLRQVLINIVQNSIDAINNAPSPLFGKGGEGGIIEISSESINNKIKLTVRDNGCGMDSDVMEKAFSSFFTTKTRGTGLGLAIVDKLVKSIGGTIELKSEAGKGTLFTIIIPKNPV